MKHKINPSFDRSVFVEMGESAAVAGILNGLRGIAREAEDNFGALKVGEINAGDFTVRIVKTGVKQGLNAGAKAALAVGLKEGVREVSKRMGWRMLWKFTIKHSGAVSSIAYGVVEQGWATVQFATGKRDLKSFTIQTAENFGATGGAISGAATGAALGSVVPGLGTTLGAVLGAYLGGHGGAWGGKTLVNAIVPEDNQQ